MWNMESSSFADDDLHEPEMEAAAFEESEYDEADTEDADAVQLSDDELASEMAIWTGQYHDKQNVGEAIAWAKKEHNLQIHTLSDAATAEWDALLAPMVENWKKEMEAKGLPAEKFIERLEQLRDKYAQAYK